MLLITCHTKYILYIGTVVKHIFVKNIFCTLLFCQDNLEGVKDNPNY